MNRQSCPFSCRRIRLVCFRFHRVILNRTLRTQGIQGIQGAGLRSAVVGLRSPPSFGCEGSEVPEGPNGLVKCIVKVTIQLTFEERKEAEIVTIWLHRQWKIPKTIKARRALEYRIQCPAYSPSSKVPSIWAGVKSVCVRWCISESFL